VCVAQPGFGPSEDVLRSLAQARDELKSWLVEAAYPLWFERGIDRVHGGFHESLSQDGQPLAVPRRARVQPRQIYAFAKAGMLGWSGAARVAVEQGLEFQLAKHRRADGLFSTLVGPDGSPLDERPLLYDQAFVLFGLAAAFTALPGRTDLRDIALRLRETLHRELEEPGSFDARYSNTPRISSNAFMHLFEACLAWHEADGEAAWLVMADEIVRFAMTRFIDPNTGAVREFFNQDWSAAPGLDGRIVEPGHQFEWAWLLLRWSARAECDEAQEVALRLVAVGEKHGVDAQRNAVMNTLLDDLTVKDPVARLWPQTERIKASCEAARATGDESHLRNALAGVSVLKQYLRTPVPGLWRDRMNPEGAFVDEPAPASSFYHIVCAILELDRAIASAGATRA
jgi:mannose/cellobiose epimerase-like protein (N-acyl-D-glucosamine 2-epimerase family)